MTQLHTAPYATDAPLLLEATASCNVYVLIAGRTVQLTIRNRDEHRMLDRLAALLARFPVPEPPTEAPQEPAQEQAEEPANLPESTPPSTQQQTASREDWYARH